jgi:hypothetical protein
VPVFDIDKSGQTSPFSKASAEVMFFSVVTIDRIKRLIIFVLTSKLVTTESY